jgi:hypothetical protein
MPALRTTVTELVTGLGALGLPTLRAALDARPPEMVSVSPELWGQLDRAHEGGALATEFADAWANGRAFLEARDGLRGRRPYVVEWKGAHRAPGDEVAPIDLRIDHVYLVSCKYLSKIVINASPSHLFERLLQGGHGRRGADWYEQVAGPELNALYRRVIGELGLVDLPGRAADLAPEQRKRLAGAIGRDWPAAAAEEVATFVDAVANRTAEGWRERTRDLAACEALLWRMLRMGSAPYFVLGSASAGRPLRLRVATPWDWRLSHRLRTFDVLAQPGGQPRVAWHALVEDRLSGEAQMVSGHVEVRWSHGRFGGSPEAKVYLDTPHTQVPGYHPLV